MQSTQGTSLEHLALVTMRIVILGPMGHLLYKAIPSILGETAFSHNTEKQTQNRANREDRGICSKQKTNKASEKDSNDMEISNLPKRLQSNG